jgi:hypothetical protein
MGAGLLLSLLTHAANCKSIDASASSTPAEATKASSSQEWLSHPPGWVTWLSLAGGLTAFTWKLYEFVVSRVDREKDQRIACDAFWYESIVVPRIVEPLIDFLGQQQEALRTIPLTSSGDAFTIYKNEYQAKYNDLAVRMSLLQVISNATHGAIMQHLDKLEDDITVHCYESGHVSDTRSSRRRSPDLNSRFSDAMSFCVTKLKDLHFGLRHPA